MSKRPVYKNAAGEKLPSVTTILNKYQDPGGLLYWANQQGLEGRTLNEAREAALDVGKALHAMVRAFLEGDEPGQVREYLALPAEQQVQADRGWTAFEEWWRRQDLEPVATEVQVISEVHQYGGTLDALCRQRESGDLVLFDWKSNKGASVYKENQLQLAAYHAAAEEVRMAEIPRAELALFDKETGDFGHHSYSRETILERFLPAFLKRVDLLYFERGAGLK